MDASNSTAAYTPTHTTEQHKSSRDEFSSPRNNLASAPPSPGRTYMIRHLASDKAISLKGGRLSLEIYDARAGHYWKCVELHGWLKFSEVVSGNYLARDNNGGFHAGAGYYPSAGFPQLTGAFVVVPGHEDGGYYLRSPDSSVLGWVGITDDGKSLVYVASAAKAALWDFLEV
ncbi:hypothetical protein F5X97DRAFT_316199 [Nemania serpens]|nr:hypothetical protein F5X97DRAFT_316199 [Nemania serpens]